MERRAVIPWNGMWVLQAPPRQLLTWRRQPAPGAGSHKGPGGGGGRPKLPELPPYSCLWGPWPWPWLQRTCSKGRRMAIVPSPAQACPPVGRGGPGCRETPGEEARRVGEQHCANACLCPQVPCTMAWLTVTTAMGPPPGATTTRSPRRGVARGAIR